jgi:hypothetical protein
MGCVLHNEDRHVRGALEAQLLSFPYSKYWDVMDAFAYSIEMFDIGERTFSQVIELQKDIDYVDEFEMLRIEDKKEKPLRFAII